MVLFCSCWWPHHSPILYEWHVQQKRKKRNSSIEKSIVSVAEMTLRFCRQLDGGTYNEQEGGRKRRRRSSRFRHKRAEQAIHEDYFAPIPVFNVRQYERIFRVSKSIDKFLLCKLMSLDDTTLVHLLWCSWLLNSLHMVAPLVPFRTSYIQMSITTARMCHLKFCRIVSTDVQLQSVFARPVLSSDARRVSAIHEEQHVVAGMVGSLDCVHVFRKNCPVAWQGRLSNGKSR